MVGQVRLRMMDRILGEGVIKIDICVDRIFKGTGVNSSRPKYSYLKKTYTQIRIFTIPLPSIISLICTRTCPTMVKSFAL